MMSAFSGRGSSAHPVTAHAPNTPITSSEWHNEMQQASVAMRDVTDAKNSTSRRLVKRKVIDYEALHTAYATAWYYNSGLQK